MLTIDTEEFSSHLRKHPERRQVSVDVGLSPARPKKRSPEQKRILPRMTRETRNLLFDRFQEVPVCGDVKKGLDASLLFRASNHLLSGLAPEKELNCIQDDRFPRPCLAAEDIQTLRERDVQ